MSPSRATPIKRCSTQCDVSWYIVIINPSQFRTSIGRPPIITSVAETIVHYLSLCVCVSRLSVNKIETGESEIMRSSENAGKGEEILLLALPFVPRAIFPFPFFFPFPTFSSFFFNEGGFAEKSSWVLPIVFLSTILCDCTKIRKNRKVLWLSRHDPQESPFSLPYSST